MRSQCAEHSQRLLLTCPWSWTTHLLHFFHSVSSLSVSIWLSDHLSCSEALLKALFQPPTSPLLHLTYRLYLKIKAYVNKLVLKHERHMSILSYSLTYFLFFIFFAVCFSEGDVTHLCGSWKGELDLWRWLFPGVLSRMLFIIIHGILEKKAHKRK